MSNEEWEAISLHLDLCFAGEWDDDKADAYWTFMGGLDAAQVMSAIGVLALAGQKFVPSVGEILGVLDAAHGPPPFDGAWRSVSRALGRYGTGDVSRAERTLEGAHPFVLDWARGYGWERLAREPVNDPDFGGAVMHRLGASYRDHVAEARLRDRAGRRGLPGAVTRQVGEPKRQLGEGA